METPLDVLPAVPPATATAASHDVPCRIRQERYKVLIWIIVSILSLSLAGHMGELMPPMFVFASWTLSESFALVGGYMLFIHGVPDSNDSGNIMKGVLWGFAAALNVFFPLQIMKRFPPELAILVYLKSGFVIIGGFYRFFLIGVARRRDPILPL